MLTELSHGAVMNVEAAGWLLGLDLHRLVDAHAFGHAGIIARVGGRDREAAFTHVGTVVERTAARLLHRDVAIADQFVERDVLAVRGPVTAFALRDGNEIVLDAGDIDRGSRTTG